MGGRRVAFRGTHFLVCFQYVIWIMAVLELLVVRAQLYTLSCQSDNSSGCMSSDEMEIDQA